MEFGRLPSKVNNFINTCTSHSNLTVFSMFSHDQIQLTYTPGKCLIISLHIKVHHPQPMKTNTNEFTLLVCMGHILKY